MDSCWLSKCELWVGSFSEERPGRWYFNVAVEVEVQAAPGTAAVEIDLGMKDCATASDEQKLPERWYRCHEQALCIA